MTATQDVAVQTELVSVTIDGFEVQVPKGTLVIRAAELLGIAIPRFCDHPLLAPAGACRQCLVEVATPGPDGSLRPMPKPQASCTLEASKGMVVRTQLTSAVAEKAQRGVMELLLINHP
ncbi:MAG TPA: 2Fe-2S iron-sulfur cluster-binding protein, partial [Mycobacteriales bacterium]|nr:2Fe-2S iron-sulfur cluster-binding protein [Mycobacteriales bacterium]